MSNLSLARIMYGSNEFQSLSGSADPRSSQSQLVNLASYASANSASWVSKLFSALFHHHPDATAQTSKVI